MRQNSIARKFCYFLLAILFLFSQSQLQAEGTKQIRPASSDNGYLVLDKSWSSFALYGSAATSRLNIRICNVGEKIYYGFRQTDNDVEYRIKDPNGNIVVGPASLPSSGNGRIGTHAQALAGPASIVGSGTGYANLTYTPTMTGDYYIEFKDKGSRRTFDLFDITVASAGNTAIDGRIWSQAWMFSTNSYTNRFKGKMYIYADDGIVTSINFNGMQPYVFVLSANPTGTQNTGNGVVDRQSRTGLSTYPQYKIFMNDPDINCFPTGSFGNLTGSPTITGCGLNKTIQIPVDTKGNILVLLDLNGVAGYQPGTADRQYSIAVVPGTNSIAWDSKDGLGNIVPSGTNMNMQVDYLNGITHMPLYDVEYNQNGYIVSLVRPSSGTTPKLFWDDSNIPAASGNSNLTGCDSPCHTWSWDGSDGNDYGNQNTINTWWYAKIITTNVSFTVNTVTVDANRYNAPGVANDTTVCNNSNSIPLAGLVAGNTTTGQWSSLTGGSFSNNTDLNATYTFTAAEKSSGLAKIVLTSTNNGSCPASQDTLTVHLVPGPTVDAGPAQNLCKNKPTATLAGTKTIATGAIWSGGAGTFIPNNTTLNATYSPTAAELSTGSVTLTLTTTGNGLCSASSDQVTLTYFAAPTVDAGSPIVKCSNNPVATLAGSTSNATSFSWTGGAGTFTPNNTTLNATYTPTAAELSSGVNLSLTAVKAGCTNVTNSVAISYTASPTVNAGSDASACSNNPNITLGGTVTVATGGAWTGGLGTFTPDRNTLNAVYTPTAAEKSTGVTLTLTTTGMGTCNAVNDQVKLSYTASPTASAGADDQVCGNKATVTLNGSVTGATGGTWIGGTGTFNPNANTLNAQYIPSAAEINAQIASLFLQTTGNGNCNAAKDTVLISILPAPTVNAGKDTSVCANHPTITLQGSSSNTSAVTWSGGGGSFSNINSATSSYTLSAAEITAGSVTLTLTGSKTTCTNVQDQVLISVVAAPTVNAGADQSLCANNVTSTLNGSFTGATGVTWSGGAGTFSPGNNTANATYTPTAAEISASSVTLTLTTTGNGNCTAVNDQVNLNFTPAPTANAGTDQTACANNPSVTLTGSTTVATGGTWSGGAGTYNPNPNSLSITYTPTAAEINSGVTLTLTTSGNGNCNTASNQVKVSYTNAPTVSAGQDQSVCEDNATVTLAGSATVATGAIWSGGAGTFTPNNTTLNATYAPTDAEKLAGTVTLTLTTTGNGNCNPVSDEMVINITKAPTIDAGQDQTLCGSVNSVSLAGSSTIATGGTWTSAGTGNFAPNNLTGAYKPSAADITAGSVTLTVTSTGNGKCNAVNDFVIINFTKVPSIYAGPDQTVCTNEFPVLLNASGSPATWSGGTGTFSNTADLNATYTPSAAETSAGSVTLTVTTNAAGACPSISDNVKISILPQPVPFAGADQTICGNSSSITLGGTMANATGGFWTTTGKGSFNPNNGTVNAIYVPSSTEQSNGATITNILTSTPNSPCPSVSDTSVITIVPKVIVSAGPDQTFCADQTTIDLNGLITNSTGGTWSVVSGAGTIDNSSSLSTTYTVASADTSAKTITLRLTSAATTDCGPVSDDVTFTFISAPKAIAGAPVTICADASSVSLTGTVVNATSGTWSSSGTGTFTPSASNLSTTYIPSDADTAAHSVTLTLTTVSSGICSATQDQLVVTIDRIPVVNAGTDIPICSDATSVNMNGSVVNATGGTWTTSGSGTFDNANALNAIYTPSNADKTGGTVTLTLTSTGMGTCNAVNDKMIITFSPVPTINAGPDLTICSDASSVTVTGTVTVATGGTWTTTGSGSFADANALSTSYTPSTADTTAGTVTLTLTSTGNGTCSTYQDAMVLTITHKPVVGAGVNSTICADSAYVSLAGSVTNAVGGQWSTSGTGTFFPSITNLNANYVPSSADKTSGSVTLTLTSTGNGKCNAVHADRIITITTSPAANAGNDQTVCASVNSINIAGTVSIATGGVWTTSGTGTFANNTSLSTTYTPSANDKAAGSVTLTLTTTGNGDCKSASDQLILTLNPVPVIDAGPDNTICADLTSLTLNGSVQFATGGTWRTSGTGVFSDTSALNASYFPSVADKASGNVTITLTSTGNGTCSAVADNLTLLITPAPTVAAGSDQTICETGSAIITGSFTVASGGTWTSTGSGMFSPNANTANATYFPSAADKTAGSVTLTFTTTGNGTCNAMADDLLLTLTPKATVDAGTDVAHCADIEFIQLNGSISNTTGATWTTDGSGNFTPDNNTLNAIYTPSTADKSGGVVTLTLTTTPGICSAAADNIKITFSPVPTASAGPDITACTGIGSVSLNPTVTVATGGVWTTTGTGSFNPDENTLNATYIPSAADQTAGSVLLILATTGNGACNQQTDTVAVDFSPVPSIEAGPAQTVCQTDLPVQLAGSGTTGMWSGGAGTFSPNANTLNATYQPTAAEIAAGSVSLTLTTTGIGSCTPGVDNVTITITPGGPSVNAGTDVQACANATNIPLAGIFGGATGIVWSTGSGTGTFSSTTDPNATFTPSALQLSAGVAHLTLTTTGNNGCNAKSDQVDVILGPAPTADAGFDQNVCSSAGIVQLNGSTTVASGVSWTIVSGNGSFDNATSLTPVYTVDPADIGLGSITLRMTTTGNGSNCNPAQDDIVISFTGAPTSNAGANSSHCADATSIALAGTSSTNSAIWSTSGSGTFSPSTTDLNASYIPSASDKSTGVTLTLTTSGNGVCAAGTSNRTLTFTAPPTVTAGADQQFCSDQPTTNLAAIFNHAGGVSWSTSGTGSFSSSTSANTIYTPSAQDIANGGVNVTITTTGSAPCAEVQDFMTMTIYPAPTSQVNAGFDQSVCKDVTSVQLDGVVTIAGGGRWTSSGSGSFAPNDSTLNASYIPSAADKASGNVILTLTTIHNGICNPGSDDIKITFTPSTTAAIAAIPNPCEDVNSVTISGSFTVAAGIVWTTAGTGSFAPNEFTSNATYIPSAQDKANGNVGLTLTTTGNGTCNASSATRSMTFTKRPSVNAGSDKTVCSDITSLSITAAIGSTTGVTWTTSGTGTFSPSNSFITTYTPSAADFAATRVNLKITANGIGTCPSSNDVVTVNFTPAPTVQAGAAQTICADLSGLTLTPQVTVATGGLWTTSGSGTFSPSASTLNAMYQPSQSDKQNGSVTLSLTTTGNGTCKPVSGQKVITIKPQPVVSSGPAVICSDLQGAQLSGSVSNATGGIWSSTGTGTFSPSATALNAIYYPSQADMSAGSVTLKLTSTGNGTCNPVSSTSKLLVGPLPVADAGNDQYVCQNSSITLVAKPSSDVKYNWENNSGASLATTESITIPVPNNTYVVLAVTDTRGCMTTDTVRLTTYNLPTLTLPPHACLTDSLVLDAQPGNMPVVPGTFQWYNGTTILSGENDFTLVVKKPGDNTIKWSYGSCEVTATTNVTMPPTLLSVDTVTACASQTANLTTTSNPATGLTFAWTTNGSNAGNTQSITAATASGISTYKVTATDALGCIAIDSIKLNGIPVPTFTIKDTTNCQGKVITLDATPTNVPGYQSMNPVYQWKEDGNVLSETNNTLTASSAGLYTVILTLDQCVGKDTATIILNPNPTDGMASDTRYCNDTQDSITLNAGTGAGYTYIWKSSTGTVLGTNQMQTVYDPGEYYVQITNSFNCIFTDSIQVNDVCKPRVDPPTAFTPDGKGPTENEKWALFARYVTNFKLTIFNRWGEIIFYTEDPNESWDGTYRGEPMPVGVYPYLITYEGLADEYKGPYKKEGSVTIVK